MTNDGTSGNVKQPRQSEKQATKPLSPFFKQAIFTVSPVVPVFRYFPKSHRKDVEAPFSESTTLESTTKPISKLKEIDWHILKGKGVLPTHKAIQSKVVRTPLDGFVVSSKGSL